MKRTLIQNATIVNEGKQFRGSVVIEGEKIAEILPAGINPPTPFDAIIDASNCYLLPGVIDGHVHFRDPGLTHKADITTESQAAVAGGVTSIMDMPNTVPQTTTIDALYEKLDLYAGKSLINYSCYFGATNDNYKLFPQLDSSRVCGIKLFMGSSTGNMLVDEEKQLNNIFNGTDMLIAAHCENQDRINANLQFYSKYKVNDDLPVKYHRMIRDGYACKTSTEKAIGLATQANARLHVLHLSTSIELSLFSRQPLPGKRITAEACIPHLMFSTGDYKTFKSLIKCNPAIKTKVDNRCLRQAVNSGKIDVISTDHAPHLLSEKTGGALKAMSGIPMIQFSLVSMLSLADEKVFTIEKIVEKMCHAPAQLYNIAGRGYIRNGYQADLVLIRQEDWEVNTGAIYSKCKWSPFEGKTFHWKVDKTFVNGNLVYSAGQMDDSYRGQELRFG